MPTPTTTGPKPGISKLDLSGLTKPKKGPAKTAYPVLPDPSGEVAPLVDVIRQEAEEFDALKGSFDLHKAELSALSVPFYFQNGAGKLEVPSSVSCHSSAGDEVLVSFANRYRETDDEAGILAIMGERTPEFVRQGFVLKIDGDQIPPDAAGEVIAELQEVLSRHNCAAALTAKSVLKPTPDFHAPNERNN